MARFLQAAVVGAVLALAVGASLLGSDATLRRYDIDGETYVGTVLVAEDGLLVAGTRIASMEPPSAGIVLLSLASDGTLEFPIFYHWEGVRTANDALAAPDGGLTFAGMTDVWSAGGNDVYALGVGPSRQTLWSGVYGTELDESAVRVLPTAGGYFLVGNQVNPSDPIADPETPGYGGLEGRCAPYIVRTQTEGQTVWQKTLATEDNVVVFDAAATDDGGVLILATAYGYPDGPDAVRLFRLDGNGETVWTRSFAEGHCKGYALLVTSSGELLVAGAWAPTVGDPLRAMMMLLDPDGNEIWSAIYGDPQRISTAHALVETADGLLIAVGTELDDYGRFSDDVYLLGVDAGGRLAWEQRHPTGEHIMVEAVTLLPDGTILVAATAAPGSEPFRPLLLWTAADAGPPAPSNP